MQHQLNPSNSLELSFQQALTDNTHAEAFYQQLVQAKLFLLSDSSDDDTIENGKPAADGTMSINIMQWYVPLEDGSAHPFAPVFTSQAAVDQAVQLMKNEGTEYHGVMELEAATIFNLLLQSGVDMVLNPNTSLSKTLDEDEVRYMLLPEVTLIRHNGRLSIVAKILHDDLPLYTPLKKVLSQYANVKHAYLIESCQLDLTKSSSDHAFILGVQFADDNNRDDFNRIRSDINTLQRKIDLNGLEIKTHHIKSDTKDAISNYCLEQITPFYSASLLSKIKGWFR